MSYSIVSVGGDTFLRVEIYVDECLMFVEWEALSGADSQGEELGEEAA